MLLARAGLYLATFMAVFDIAVVYLALPDMERSIGAGIADQQWIASAYGLMEAGFTLSAGTLGDLWGRRRVYIAGVALFIVASIASGLAPNPTALIAARFVQGIGGAIAMALPLAMLVAMSRDPQDREASIRMYATIAGLGAVTAPALGGLLVASLGWRAIFFVNVPVAAFVLYAALVHTPASPRDPAQQLDLGGQLTSALSLIALSFAAIEGSTLGWTSPPILGAAAFAVAGFAAFFFIERHVRVPMIDFSLLRQPLLAAGAWNLFAINLGFFTMYLIASLFLQNVARMSPLHAGWYLLANNLVFFLTNTFSGGLTARLGLRWAALGGTLIGALGLAMFTTFNEQTPPLLVALPLALTGFGWGLAFTPFNSLAMSAVPTSKTGLASGLLSLGRPLGAVFGSAVFGSILAANMRARLDEALTPLRVSDDISARIMAALHHGGLWSLPGTASAYGVPNNTFRWSIDAGFVAGMHVSTMIVAALALAGAWYALHAFRAMVAPNPATLGVIAAGALAITGLLSG